MVDVLVERITSRLKYTMDFIFEAHGIEYRLLTDTVEFHSSKNKKLYYGNENVDCPTVPSSSLLFENGIKAYSLTQNSFVEEECMEIDGVVDPIASIFYTLTRYEEYLATERDEHGRFPLKKSVQYKWGWIQKAVCDRWANAVLMLVEEETLKVSNSTKLIPTFDIDNAYAYKYKSGKRKWLSIARDIKNFDKARLKERRVVRNEGHDPYDTFDRIMRISKENENSLVFWLVGDLAPKDRNLSIEISEHQDLIRRVEEVVEVNLHPSYASNEEVDKLKYEKQRLEKVLGRSINRSRQHFLKFDIGETYANLEATGFKHEYSMGFAEAAGFRCGTARSHQWYNLLTDEVSGLTIHPFTYMDGSLNEYMGLSIEESKKTGETIV